MAGPSNKRAVAPKSSTGLRGRSSEYAFGEGGSTHCMQAQGVPVPAYKCLSTAESNTMLRMSSLPRWAHPFPRSLSLHTLVIERSRVSSQQTKYRQQILLGRFLGARGEFARILPAEFASILVLKVLSASAHTDRLKVL
jgi:hypothetical protein